MDSSIEDGPELRNGVMMPWLGLGVLGMPANGSARAAVSTALEVGCRRVDTAASYGNESEVGQAIRSSGVPRSRVFVTTKVWNVVQGYHPTRAAFDVSLERLGIDYVDLCLVHWPFAGDFHETWRALEAVYREGRARAIGVSNFLVHHLEELLKLAEMLPMVNQVELHPLLQQPKLRSYCRAQHIQVEAWRPLMHGAVTDIPALVTLAEKHGKTPVQVVLRWILQKEVVAIPKTSRRHRMESNADVFDFELPPEDVKLIDSLNEGRRLGPHPDEFRPSA